jgi:hypothetical protein
MGLSPDELELQSTEYLPAREVMTGLDHLSGLPEASHLVPAQTLPSTDTLPATALPADIPADLPPEPDVLSGGLLPSTTLPGTNLDGLPEGAGLTTGLPTDDVLGNAIDLTQGLGLPL